MKGRTPLRYNAQHALRQVRGAITSARLAAQLETTTARERNLWRVALSDLREAEYALRKRVAVSR